MMSYHEVSKSCTTIHCTGSGKLQCVQYSGRNWKTSIFKGVNHVTTSKDGNGVKGKNTSTLTPSRKVGPAGVQSKGKDAVQTGTNHTGGVKPKLNSTEDEDKHIWNYIKLPQNVEKIFEKESKIEEKEQLRQAKLEKTVQKIYDNVTELLLAGRRNGTERNGTALAGEKHGHSGSKAGAIAGGIIGSLLALVIIVFIVRKLQAAKKQTNYRKMESAEKRPLYSDSGSKSYVD